MTFVRNDVLSWYDIIGVRLVIIFSHLIFASVMSVLKCDFEEKVGKYIIIYIFFLFKKKKNVQNVDVKVWVQNVPKL